MKKICLLTSIILCGSIGWWLGDHIGVSAALLGSFIGNLVGVYVGVRVNREYLS